MAVNNTLNKANINVNIAIQSLIKKYEILDLAVIGKWQQIQMNQSFFVGQLTWLDL